jgi:multicomponent Na+:H+ antiporter subunit E
MFFIAHLVLTLLLAVWLGGLTPRNLAVGLVAGYLLLWLVARFQGKQAKYFIKTPLFFSFLAYYAWELLKSNAVILYEILTPGLDMRPGVVGIPIRARTDLEITILANLITMTPGTLSLDISPDRRTLYIHAMYIHDPEALRKDIQDNLERRVLELLA